MNINDVIIMGAGPAGLATALQLNRYGIVPLVFERDLLGGLLRNANLVENYPGFPDGITGRDLVNLFEKQAQVNSLKIIYEDVNHLNYLDGFFQVTTSHKDYQSHIVVIATGTKPRVFPDLKIPDSLTDRVFYEVYPVLSLESKRIAIVGGGDAAFDYALNLCRNNDVLILNRSENISCLPLLWDRAKASSRITYLADTHILQVTPALDQSISLDINTAAGPDSIQVDVLIGAIGREPQLDFLSGHFSEKAIQLERQGCLYYVGDVVNGLYRQTAIAVGNGTLAAMKIFRLLREKDL